MGFRSYSGSRQNSGNKSQKSTRSKTKSPTGKHAKYVEEPPQPTLQDEAQKTLTSLQQLGTQTFALSPFSQYFDDWLVNLRQVLSEFEANPVVSVDEVYSKERSDAFQDLEAALAQSRLKEAHLDASAKTLAEQNHLLVETDAEYARQIRELAEKRNCDLERLTKEVNQLEADLAAVEGMKTSFFGFTKKAKVKKEAEVTAKLNTAKTTLEVTVENFRVNRKKCTTNMNKKSKISLLGCSVWNRKLLTLKKIRLWQRGRQVVMR
jgi:predicted transcriptional regulator